MSASRHRAWIGAALLFGAAYLLIGRLFTLPADHLRAWRLAAWLVSAVAYAAHIGYEHFKLRSPLRSLALHVALGVAVGALGLAVAGMIHSLAATSTLRPTWLLALVAWPAITAIPAYLGALIAGQVLARLLPGTDTQVADGRSP